MIYIATQTKLKEDKKMAKIYSLTEITEFLECQQENVAIVDKYTQPILSKFKNKIPINDRNRLADFVMQHIFTNVRNIYQDSIFISQGLLQAKPYYISTSLSYTQREAQDFLIDLAYIMSDKKHNQGDEYLHYLLFIIDQERKEHENLGLKTLAKEAKKLYDNLLSNNTHITPRKGSFWSDISPKERMKKGLELYRIEPPHFTGYRHSIRHNLSSTAHGNNNTIFTFTDTDQENIQRLETTLAHSVPFFEVVMRSAIKCYFLLYLNKQKEFDEIFSSIYPAEEVKTNN